MFNPNFIAELNDAFINEYKEYFGENRYHLGYKVGDKRIQIGLDIKGPFNTPILYANDKLLPVLRALLSDKMILGSVGSVASLPGAGQQHIHRDNPIIFGKESVYEGGNACVPQLPPYAITVAIPLIPADETTGTTRVWLGSHLVEDYEGGQAVDPYLDPGDCLLFDYRVKHCGLPNKSDQIRPLVYLTYHRPWFRDVVGNYSETGLINISPQEYKKIPSQHIKLFDWMLFPMSSIPISQRTIQK